MKQAHGLDPNRLISQYGHTVWRSDEGILPRTLVITQTTDGYIWMADKDRLFRFDGTQISPWQPPNGTRLPGTVTYLLGARDGSLWIGMRTGVSRLKDGELSTYTNPGDHFGISVILEDHAGKIWLTRYGAGNNQGGLCEVAGPHLHCYGKSDGLSTSYGLGVTEDLTGNLWVAGDRGLYRWKPGVQGSRYLDAIKLPQVSDVAVDHSGNVWAAMDASGSQAGLQYLHNGVWGEYSVSGFHSSALRSNYLFVDRAGAVWIGTENDGLYRVWKGVVDHFSKNDGLSGHEVVCIYEDREGNLWTTTDGGLDMFRNTPVITYSVDEGLSSNSVQTVLGLIDGTVWTGNYDGVAWSGEEAADILQTGTSRRFSPGPKLPGTIGPMFQDHSGALWLGVGLSIVAYEHGKAQRVLGQDGHVFEDKEHTTAILEDPAQAILVVNGTTLFRIRERRVVNAISLPKRMPRGGLLAVNPSGGTWIAGYREGLMLYKDGIFHSVSLPNTKEPLLINDIFSDSVDPLLVATSIGLLRWDSKRWELLDEAKGLPCNQLFGVIKDSHDSLWLEADCGLLKAEASDIQRWRENSDSRLSFTIFDALDGAQTGTAHLIQPRMSLAPDGRVWFANGHKVEVINPDQVYRNLSPPPVYVEQLITDNKAYPSTGQLHIPPNPHNLEIDYTGLSFSVPQRVLFRYFLEGHDAGWQGPLTRRRAFYTDLGPGTYRFHVIACNSSGLWNETGAITTFVVEPTLYQTLWFKILVAVTGAGLLWALYLLRLKRATANVQSRMLAQMEERERIARELHDTLLQGFQGIALRVQGVTKKMPLEDPLREKMEEVLDRADEVLLEGRQRVRSLRQRTVNEDDLTHRLEKCGQDLSLDHPASFSLATIGTPKVLESTLQDEAYRIACEALTNAFQHASASKIEVEVTYDATMLRIRVRDDGVGVDKAVLMNGHPGHWGLTGMRERAHAIRSQLNIWSREAAGTEVELVIPASIAYPQKPSRANSS